MSGVLEFRKEAEVELRKLEESSRFREEGWERGKVARWAQY